MWDRFHNTFIVLSQGFRIILFVVTTQEKKKKKTEIAFIINYIDKMMFRSQDEDQSKTKLQMCGKPLITKSG